MIKDIKTIENIKNNAIKKAMFLDKNSYTDKKYLEEYIRSEMIKVIDSNCLDDMVVLVLEESWCE